MLQQVSVSNTDTYFLCIFEWWAPNNGLWSYRHMCRFCNRPELAQGDNKIYLLH